MNKPIFNLKLFFEGVKQLRLAGGVLLIISLAASVVPAISSLMHYLDAMRSKSFYDALSSVSLPIYSQINNVKMTDVAPTLILLMFIAPVILCLVIFNFLNMRKSSDFYHALPHSRTSIFLSFGAAVLFWVYIIIIATIIAASVIYNFEGKYFSFSYTPWLIFTYASDGKRDK